MKSHLSLLSFFLCRTTFIEATDYYVSNDGLDENSGAKRSPFKTIQHAVDQLMPGDKLFIRGGRYHESVKMENIDGTADAPIVIRNFRNEKVIIDGTENVDDISDGEWTHHSGNIFKRTLTKDVTQLFVDDRYQIIARWPNANTNPADRVVRKTDDWNAEDGSWWNKETTWAHAEMPGTTVDGNVETDPSYHDLAATGLSFEGGSVILALIGQGPGNGERRINHHPNGTNSFTHEPLDDSMAGKGYSHSKTYIIEHLNALDQAEEWYYTGNTLYLWADDGENPKNRSVRGRTISHAFDMEDCNYVTIQGINFFASNFKTDWAKTSTNIQIDSCELLYPDASERILGNYPYNPDESDYQTSLRGNNNALINSVIKYSEHGAILFDGDSTEAHNNLFHHIAIRGIGYTAAILQVTKFTRNTVYIAGSRAVVKTNSNPEGFRIQTHNLIDGWGFQQVQTDGSALQCNSAKSTGTVRAYNWFLNSHAYGSRWDGHTGDGGLNHHQVGYRVNGAMQIKGDNHDTHSNTCIESWEMNDFIILAEATKNGGIENENSRTWNNIGDKIAGHRFQVLSEYPIPGDHLNNWNGYETGTSAADQLRDPANLDFRPKKDSDFIDAGKVIPDIADSYVGNAPDQGAYEFGDSSYWIPGRQTDKASTPVPPNNAKNVKLDADLMFLEGKDAVSHDVYFGTSRDSLTFQGNQATNIFTPPSLEQDTKYFWRVDEVKEDGTKTTGSVFRFVTNTIIGGDYSFETTGDTFMNPNDGERNYGNVGRLRIGRGRYSLFRFDVNGVTGSITSAKLQIMTKSKITSLRVYVSYGQWEENNITPNNYNLQRGSEYVEFVDLSAENLHDLDVTPLVSGNNIYTLELDTSVEGVTYQVYGKESSNTPTPTLNIHSE